MSFPDQLKHLLDERGMSMREFSRRTKRSATYISHVIRGKYGPPDDLDRWAEVLKLQGEDRESFLLAGSLLRSPQRVRDYVLKLERVIVEMKPDTTPKAKRPARLKT